MHIALLQTFVAVMHTGSVSLAAERLFLTQPAISKRLKNLEEDLGAPLFFHVGRKLKPTPAAHTLLTYAEQWLRDYEDLQHRLSHDQEQVTGILRLGTSHHIGLHHLPAPLKAFVQRHPQVKLDVHFVDSEQAHHAVLSGDLDLACLTFPPLHDERLVYRPLWLDPLLFVTAPFHELAQQPQVSLADLAQVPAILPAAHTYTSQITLAAFANIQKRLHATMSTNPLESIRMLVSIGLGWSVLPATLLNEDLAQLQLTDAPALSRTLGAVWHPKRTLSRAAQALINELESVSNTLPFTQL